MRSHCHGVSLRQLVNGFAVLVWVSAAVAFDSPLLGEEPAVKKSKAPEFVRIRKNNDEEPEALETAIVTYRKAGSDSDVVSVDLIGAVHIADRTYFKQLNDRFAGYDAVLYELVAPPEQTVPKSGQRSAHPVSVLQVTMKNVLGLEFQLDRIDYRKPNLVHADLSPDEFAQSMKDRGESFMQIVFRAIGQGVAVQSKDPGRSSDASLLAAFFSRDRATELKKIMAQQMLDMDQAEEIFGGPNGSTIITARNQRAIEVLRKELAAGKKKLSIFYGAAHLPDFHARLLSEFGMSVDKHAWLSAWDLTGSAK